MTRGRILMLLLCVGLLLFGSCDPLRVVDDYRSIPEGIWHSDSVMTFSFNVIRKTQNHNIWFNIRNDRSYEFSNLWLFVTIDPPRGEPMTDTVQVLLAEPSGKWLGKGFSGVYDNRLVYRQNVFFPEPGKYSIHLRHGMRPDVLKGITDIGIRVEKVN